MLLLLLLILIEIQNNNKHLICNAYELITYLICFLLSLCSAKLHDMCLTSQSALTCSRLTIETLGQSVKKLTIKTLERFCHKMVKHTQTICYNGV